MPIKQEATGWPLGGYVANMQTWVYATSFDLNAALMEILCILYV